MQIILALRRNFQEAQYLQTVAFDVKVLGGIPVHAVLRRRTESGSTVPLYQPRAVAFALPLKLILFKVVYDVLAAKEKQLVNLQLSLDKAF